MEPEPEGLPVLDLLTGRAARVSLSPLGWVEAGLRPAGVSLGALLALARCALPWARPARGRRRWRGIPNSTAASWSR